MPKVRIAKVPQVKSRVRIAGVPNAAGAPFFNQSVPSYQPSELSSPAFTTGRTLKSVPDNEANIEAEKGETALMPDKGGLPAHYNIEGNRHVNGGTKLNVPKDTFIYSDTKKMRIKDPEILAEFGKSKGSYTPADLAKKYDINKFRKILQDPDSDPIQVSTAEKMIANYNLKLGKLALVQESKKGFPQGIPAVAMPYLSTFNINPDQVLPLKAEEQMTQDIPHEDVTPKAGMGYIVMRQEGGKVSPDTIVSNFYKDQQKQLAAQDAAVKARVAQLQSMAATEQVRKELAALNQKRGMIQGQRRVLEQNLSRSTSQLYPHLGEQSMLSQWLGVQPDVITPDLRYNVPQYQKDKAAYEAFVHRNPQASYTGEPSKGEFYGNYNTYDPYAQFMEPIPSGGIPGFAPTGPPRPKTQALPAASADPMDKEVSDLMKSENISRKEALYILTGK